MANTAVQLGQHEMHSAGNTLYTVPGATTSILKSFDICNTIAQLIRIRVHLVPSGGSADTGNCIMYDYPIPGNGVFGWEGEQVMATGDFIYVKGDIEGCTITASGVQIA